MSPENVTVCDAQSLPPVIKVSCTYMSPTLPLWIVTGLVGNRGTSLLLSQSEGSLSYTMGSTSMNSDPGIATLTVDRSMGSEVTVGTCFMCRISTTPATESVPACVEKIGESYEENNPLLPVLLFTCHAE